MNFRRFFYLASIISLAVGFCGCDILGNKSSEEEAAFSDQEIKSGGDATVYQSDNSAFSRPAPNLNADQLEKHNAGDTNFEVSFVTAPADIHGGLGPLFNNSNCNSCHVNDGRGKPFFIDGSISSVLIRLSINGNKPGAPVPVPGFGTQLQNKAVFGKQIEADVEVIYSYIKEKLADGSEVELRKPTYNVINSYTSLPDNVHTSVRTAPSVFGLGLLQAIPEQQILLNADPSDMDGDGISGKPNYVLNDATGEIELGRFGWKANHPTLLQQVASAYNQDMGITSPYYPEENVYQNSSAEDGMDDDPEITQQILEETTFYVETLGVPAKRNVNDPMVKLGKKLFTQAGCHSCHTPHHSTSGDYDVPELSNQEIFPYTDLLLHDMGEGLADDRSDFDANGKEWRTSPLWGIGLVQVVNGHQNFLHDGRARNLMEAILWHGGEAIDSKEYVKELSESERDALIAFLKSI